MREFYEICRVLKVTPAQFFRGSDIICDEDEDVINRFDSLMEDDKNTVRALIKRLQNK